MVAVWVNAARFEFRSKVTTWMFGITYRTALTSLRKSRKENGDVKLDDVEEIADTKGPSLEGMFDQRRVKQALTKLPAELRAVIELTYY